MSKFNFPPMITKVYEKLKAYDFIYRSEYDSTMRACFEDVVNKREEYEEFFGVMNKTLEINADDGYVHIICNSNKEQNVSRSLKVCAIVYLLMKLSSENSIMVNGEPYPGNRFTEAQINEARMNPEYLSRFPEKAKTLDELRVTLDNMLTIGLLEIVPGGIVGHREFIMTPVVKYYKSFTNRIANVVRSSGI